MLLCLLLGRDEVAISRVVLVHRLKQLALEEHIRRGANFLHGALRVVLLLPVVDQVLTMIISSIAHKWPNVRTDLRRGMNTSAHTLMVIVL